MSDYPECFRHVTRKARKPHKCCECRGVISAGEKYHYTSGIWDGRAESYKECSDCHELRDTIPCHDQEDVPFTGLCEFVFNGGDKQVIEKFIAIKRARGVDIQKWMVERLEDEA